MDAAGIVHETQLPLAEVKKVIRYIEKTVAQGRGCKLASYRQHNYDKAFLRKRRFTC